jgi:hypothetical protein
VWKTKGFCRFVDVNYLWITWPFTDTCKLAVLVYTVAFPGDDKSAFSVRMSGVFWDMFGTLLTE